MSNANHTKNHIQARVRSKKFSRSRRVLQFLRDLWAPVNTTVLEQLGYPMTEDEIKFPFGESTELHIQR